MNVLLNYTADTQPTDIVDTSETVLGWDIEEETTSGNISPSGAAAMWSPHLFDSEGENMVEEVNLSTCRRCGRDGVEMHKTDAHLCVDCVKAYNCRITYTRNHTDIVAQAAASGLNLWERQPGETQWEYTVWITYRDAYPGKRPTYQDAAEQLCCTRDAVRAIAARWSFQARLQAWIKHCEDVTLLQRRDEILAMNQAHVDMAKALRSKLTRAIDMIDPEELKPSEINGLVKTMSELERKAHMDAEIQSTARNEMLVDIDGSGAVKKQATEQGDLGEVVQILLKAGALGSITTVTAKETTLTTERELTLGLDPDSDAGTTYVEEQGGYTVQD